MKTDSVLHPSTHKTLERIKSDIFQAYIFSGPKGSGKTASALELARHWSDPKPPELLRLNLDILGKKSIGVEAISGLLTSLSLSYKGAQRVVLLENAETITSHAQNALLKTLEEAPTATTFIFCTDSAAALLPTIRSRAQIVHFYPPETSVVQNFFTDQGYEKDQISKLSMSSDGSLSSMQHLLEDNEAKQIHQECIGYAKDLLGGVQGNKHIAGEALLKSNEKLAQTLDILGRIIRISIINGGQTKHWERKLKVCLQAKSLLQKNVNPKLVVDFLVLSL